jgi:hypothetical protein
MPALRYCTKPNSHFLADVSHWPQKDFDPDEAEEEKGAGNGVCCDSARVVVGNHHYDAWSSYNREDGKHFGESAPKVV